MGAVGGALGMAMSAKPVQQMLITKPRTANCWYESKFLRTENNVCVLYKPSGLGPNQVWRQAPSLVLLCSSYWSNSGVRGLMDQKI